MQRLLPRFRSEEYFVQKYPKKGFTQIYRDLYVGTMLVPMADRNQQKHLSLSFATKA